MFITFLLATASLEAPVSNAVPDCSYDLEAMLALDRNEFDQDLDGGWRPLGQTEGCEAAAAELIREWRHEKRDHTHILYWHEGQLRAEAGQTEHAIALFELTRQSQDFDANFGWNHYVDGTIAFLRGDRLGFDLSIGRLAETPAPEGGNLINPDGTVIEMSWPPNMRVLRRFEQCWGRSYADAYGQTDCELPSEDDS